MTRALLDANVLYPASVRDVFLQLAASDVFQAKWTADIHREWIEALLRNEPHRDRAALQRTRDLMDRETRDCLVTEYEAFIPILDNLPDPDDRHVLAAAIAGRCDAIVTSNLRHFPNAAVEPFSIDVRHPDEFLCDCLNLAPGAFCEAIRKVRSRLKKPPFTVREYLDNLSRQGLAATAAELDRFSTDI